MSDAAGLLELLSAATPSLSSGGKNQAGRGIRSSHTPASCQRRVGLASMRVQAVVKCSPILPTPLAFRALGRRLQLR
jgi:hypothetical protein